VKETCLFSGVVKRLREPKLGGIHLIYKCPVLKERKRDLIGLVSKSTDSIINEISALNLIDLAGGFGWLADLTFTLPVVLKLCKCLLKCIATSAPE
jgi:hypothetical protein